MIRGRNQVELLSGESPAAVNAIVNAADSPAITKSEHIASPNPPPAAIPFTAVTTGARIRAKREKVPCSQMVISLRTGAEPVGLVRERLEVSSRAEHPPDGIHDKDPDRGILVAANGDVHHLLAHVDMERVPRIRTIQGHAGNAAVDFEVHVPVVHDCRLLR